MDFRASLAAQATACDRLGSPFMGRLMRLLHERLQPDGPVTRRLFDWPGDAGGTADAVALRLAGALHGLVLAGACPQLARAYPPNAPSDDMLFAAVTAAIDEHGSRIDAWLDSPPQTNEVRRAATLIPAGHWLARRTTLPLVLSEIGASGGLNLNWDRFALVARGRRLGPDEAVVTLTPDWRGKLPLAGRPQVAERRGVDLRPIDAGTAEGRLRLLSFIWPDQPERIARTRAALSLPAAPLDAADAVDWLPGRLAAQPEGTAHMIYSTIAWQYLPAEARARGQGLIEAAGANATPQRPLCWFRMEPDGTDNGAALTMRFWPGNLAVSLGRAGFHGEWIDWQVDE